MHKCKTYSCCEIDVKHATFPSSDFVVFVDPGKAEKVTILVHRVLYERDMIFFRPPGLLRGQHRCEKCYLSVPRRCRAHRTRGYRKVTCFVHSLLYDGEMSLFCSPLLCKGDNIGEKELVFCPPIRSRLQSQNTEKKKISA